MSAVYETVSAGLAKGGTEVVFGVMGSGTDQITRELVEVMGVRYVATRHEHGAVAMADGYHRATGRIGVALVSADAGVTNAMTALTTAHLARSSVLVIAGDQAATSKADQTRVDQVPILAALGVRTVLLSQKTAERDLEYALRQLDLGRGPVVLNLPWDIGNERDPGSAPLHPLRREPRLRWDAVASSGTLDDLMGLVALAERPLVLAGRGAVKAGAAPVLRQLAEATGAVTATTLLAKSLFRDDPYSLGVCGSFSTESSAAAIAEADLVLAFGCSLNSHTRGHGALFAGARVIQVDADADALGRWGPIHLGVVGDVAAIGHQLLDAAGALAEAGADPQRWRTPAMADRIAAFDPWPGPDLMAAPPGFASPYEVMRLCDDVLPRERLVAIDIGYFLSFPAVYLTPGAAPSMICPWEYGAIGCALGPALGAAMGRPDLYPVLVVGDGGMAATLNELDTVVRCGVPMLVLVMDDGGYRAERELFRRREQSTATADTPSPNFVGVARALGFDATQVRSGGEMRSTLAGLRLDRPTLVQVMIDPSGANPEMERAMQGL